MTKDKFVESTCLVHLGDDRRANLLDLLLLVFKLVNLGQLVAVQPLHCLIYRLLDALLVLVTDFAGNLQTHQPLSVGNIRISELQSHQFKTGTTTVLPLLSWLATCTCPHIKDDINNNTYRAI